MCTESRIVEELSMSVFDVNFLGSWRRYDTTFVRIFRKTKCVHSSRKKNEIVDLVEDSTILSVFITLKFHSRRASTGRRESLSKATKDDHFLPIRRIHRNVPMRG